MAFMSGLHPECRYPPAWEGASASCESLEDAAMMSTTHRARVRLPSLSHIAKIVLLAAVYAVLARLGLMMDAVAGFATLVWPPTGIALAALLTFGFSLWPGVALGALVANLWAGAPLLVAAGIAIGNTLEALIGAYLLRHFVGFRGTLERLVDVIGLVVFAGLLSTTVSATVGVTSLFLGGIIDRAHIPNAWSAWWLGDLMGDLVVAPVMLSWLWRPWPAGPSRYPHFGLRVAEAISLFLLTVGLTATIFGPSSVGLYSMKHVYSLFPVLIWAALRFGVRGATPMTLIVSTIAIWGTALGHGPFVRETLTSSLFPLQSFMAIMTLTTLVLATTISERDRAVDQAQQATRGREEVLAVVSHDLSNLLNAIHGGTHVLMLGLQDSVLPSVQKSLQLIQRSSKRMARLIGDLLDSATLESGTLSLETAPQDVDETLREALEMMEPSASQKGLRLVAVFLGTPLEVVYDRARVVQVLTNLIGNAIKFTREGAIQIGVRRTDGELLFEVADSGRGIPAEQIDHIFDRYWKGRPAEPDGHGLGLHIARGIVLAHSGRIWAESHPDKGSTFSFTLPLSS
jgi:signal transduction histidine kinase